MTKTEYKEIEAFMRSKMQDSAHDMHHVYRVLNSALDIASHIDTNDIDALIAACLLHDIGREEQFTDLELCHATIGGEMAYDFLLSLKWSEQRAQHVKECISTHRIRKGNAPQSIEAKILFDADKLDICGAMGIARTLIYGGQIGEPLYIIDEDGKIVVDGGGGEISSFFQEINYKLNKLDSAFYTEYAKEIAIKRKKTAIGFCESLYAEIADNYANGIRRYEEMLSD